MIILHTTSDEVRFLNMRNFDVEQTATKTLASGAGQKSGFMRIRLYRYGLPTYSVRVRFADVKSVYFESRIHYSDIMVNEETFLNIFTKGERDACQKNEA